MSEVIVMRKWAGTTLNDSINNYLISFLFGFFMAPVLELNCHTVNTFCSFGK